jgi:hypothetical protein
MLTSDQKLQKWSKSGPPEWRSETERAKLLISLGEPVAQAVEHVTFNHRVPGSSPGRLTKTPPLRLRNQQFG